MKTRKSKSGQIRQGDVLLVPIKKLPEGLKRVEGKVILAKGEVTGHAHVVGEPEAAEAWRGGADDDADLAHYVVAKKNTKVTHEEHAAVALKKGVVYESPVQVDYSEERTRKVAD